MVVVGGQAAAVAHSLQLSINRIVGKAHIRGGNLRPVVGDLLELPIGKVTVDFNLILRMGDGLQSPGPVCAIPAKRRSCAFDKYENAGA